MEKTQGAGLDSHRPAMGDSAGLADYAVGPLPVADARLSHPESHPGYHLTGFGEFSTCRLEQTLLSPLGDGTDLAQYQDHSSNGSSELQDSRELRPRDSPAFPGP